MLRLAPSLGLFYGRSMALNNDGFEGGVFLTLEQQAELRGRQHAARQQPEQRVAGQSERKRTRAKTDKHGVSAVAESAEASVLCEPGDETVDAD